MTLAVLFGVISVILFLLFLFLLDLAVFWYIQKKKFHQLGKQSAYLEEIEKLHKKIKHPIKKNVLLHFLIQGLILQGREKQGKALAPFLKKDCLFSIGNKTL